MYEEMMTNTDNVESILLTSNLLNICSLYKFYYKLHMSSCGSSRVLYEVCCRTDKCGQHIALYRTIVYHCLQGSTMGCSLKVTRAGVAG